MLNNQSTTADNTDHNPAAPRTESQAVTVLIAGRPYPLRVKAADEAALHRLVKELNDKILLFQNTYPSKDKQDCIAMALLTYAVELHRAQQTQNVPDSQKISEKIQQLNTFLDSVLA